MKLAKHELQQFLGMLMKPDEYGLSEKDGDEILLSFCAGCPDPVGAWWLLVECLDPMSDDEPIDCVLAMPIRSMVDVPFAELSAEHPLRKL